MIILDVGTWYALCGLNCQKGKISTGTFEMSFSRFGPFWVWGVTYIACKLSHWLINVFFFFFMRKDHHLVYVIPFFWLRPSVCYSKIWTSTFVHKKRNYKGFLYKIYIRIFIIKKKKKNNYYHFFVVDEVHFLSPCPRSQGVPCNYHLFDPSSSAMCQVYCPSHSSLYASH